MVRPLPACRAAPSISASSLAVFFDFCSEYAEYIALLSKTSLDIQDGELFAGQRLMAERPAAEWLYPCSASVKALEEDFTAMLASSSSECDTPLGDATAACVPGVGQLGTSEKSIARERMDSLECFVQGTEIYNRRCETRF